MPPPEILGGQSATRGQLAAETRGQSATATGRQGSDKKGGHGASGHGIGVISWSWRWRERWCHVCPFCRTLVGLSVRLSLLPAVRLLLLQTVRPIFLAATETGEEGSDNIGGRGASGHGVGGQLEDDGARHGDASGLVTRGNAGDNSEDYGSTTLNCKS
jgi:hypothetical protein